MRSLRRGPRDHPLEAPPRARHSLPRPPVRAMRRFTATVMVERCAEPSATARPAQRATEGSRTPVMSRPRTRMWAGRGPAATTDIITVDLPTRVGAISATISPGRSRVDAFPPRSCRSRRDQAADARTRDGRRVRSWIAPRLAQRFLVGAEIGALRIVRTRARAAQPHAVVSTKMRSEISTPAISCRSEHRAAVSCGSQQQFAQRLALHRAPQPRAARRGTQRRLRAIARPISSLRWSPSPGCRASSARAVSRYGQLSVRARPRRARVAAGGADQAENA